ncbi:MAG: hypothetical protein B7Z66_09995 [Chromatiales bacterium 21-64-14]|nr:MAG: hypothetical protein B7Z66_09995 [Chromatiales bacterium 21-64-14]HQU16211.1 DUF2007 domain-containing protein [Gammaproteobacteria bacterium]
MKRVYTAQNGMLVSHLRNVLEAQGIPCVLKNEYLGGAAGELPLIEVWPELWVQDDARYQQAQVLVEQTLTTGPEAGPAWTCPRCNEPIEGQFTDCWHCGAPHPDP